MAQPIPCDNCGEAVANLLIHNVGNGEVNGLCFACAPGVFRAMADIFEGNETAPEAGQVQPEPEPVPEVEPPPDAVVQFPGRTADAAEDAGANDPGTPAPQQQSAANDG